MLDLLPKAEGGGTGRSDDVLTTGFEGDDKGIDREVEYLVAHLAITGEIGGIKERPVSVPEVHIDDDRSQKLGGGVMIFTRNYPGSKMFGVRDVGRRMFLGKNRGVFASDFGTNYIMPKPIGDIE